LSNLDFLLLSILLNKIKASVSSEVDEKIVEEFNKRNKEIEKLRNEVNKKKEKLENYQQDYEDLKNGWIEKVEEMILNINDKFTELFKQLKCAGEISLSRPDDSDDFAKYGVCIKVSFRSDEKLQELTAWQQSGGEKSVSTMMYMIALQEMTKCPFRVVDEINQVRESFSFHFIFK
jgi:chromosome segregation ATPase